MTNEKSFQVAQGLSILSLLVSSGQIDGAMVALCMGEGAQISDLMTFQAMRIRQDDGLRAQVLDAIEMVSP